MGTPGSKRRAGDAATRADIKTKELRKRIIPIENRGRSHTLGSSPQRPELWGDGPRLDNRQYREISCRNNPPMAHIVA